MTTFCSLLKIVDLFLFFLDVYCVSRVLVLISLPNSESNGKVELFDLSALIKTVKQFNSSLLQEVKKFNELVALFAKFRKKILQTTLV